MMEALADLNEFFHGDSVLVDQLIEHRPVCTVIQRRREI